MELWCLLHVSAILSRRKKIPSLPIGGCVGSSYSVYDFEKREMSSARRESNPDSLVVQLVA